MLGRGMRFSGSTVAQREPAMRYAVTSRSAATCRRSGVTGSCGSVRGEAPSSPRLARCTKDSTTGAWATSFALEDDYFVSRKLYPNVDFYSGIVQRALGIPVAMFTCIFSLARTIGWIAQWQEMITDPEYKIGRPRQLYKGATRRDVKPLDKR